jgi:hypothetical protein
MLFPPHVWFADSTSPPPTLAEYAMVTVPFEKNPVALICACDGSGIVVDTLNGNDGFCTITGPLGPMYVSDEIVPSPVCVALYCTSIVPEFSVNRVGPIDRGGLHAVCPPGPVPDDPHAAAIPTSASAALHRHTLTRRIRLGAEGFAIHDTTSRSARERTKHRHYVQSSAAARDDNASADEVGR